MANKICTNNKTVSHDIFDSNLFKVWQLSLGFIFFHTELIQTIGSVFSDGMGADGAIRRRFGGGGGGGDGGGGGGGIERPKINLKSLDQKFDRAAEEERLKELLRDDFIDDLTTGNLVPVQLPMIDTGKVFKEEVKKEEDEVKITKEQMLLSILKRKLRYQ